MSYRLREVPSPQATLPEIADFMEYQCLKSEDKIYSVISGVGVVGIFEDENNEPGYVSESETYQLFDDALAEIENRKAHSRGNYPFNAETSTIQLDCTLNKNTTTIYTFLLLATRENMSTNKIANGIDGTQLFEKLCAAVLKNFFGQNSQSLIFGTGSGISENFQGKVERILDNIGEDGYIFRIPENNRNREQDAKVDIVAYIPFSDRNKGQFLAFGQCKTGTSWRGSVSQMIPKSFSESYIYPPFLFTPIVVFMVSESFNDNWEITFRNSGGLIFDRERIMEYVPEDIDDDLLSKIENWNSAVMERDSQ